MRDSTQVVVKRASVAAPAGTTPGLLLPLGRDPESPGQPGRDTARFDWLHAALARARQELESLRAAEELHRLLFEKVPHPRFVCDPTTLRILEVNVAAVRRYGYSRAELLQKTITDLGVPDDAARLRKRCRRGGAAAAPDRPALNRVFRQRTKPGVEIEVELDAAPIALPGREVVLVLVNDVTARRQAERRMRVQHAATRALAECSTVAEASPRIFQALGECLDCDWGELWRIEPSAKALHCSETWHPAGQRWVEMERATQDAMLARGDGLAGQAWARNKPVWIADLARQPGLPRALVATRYGLRSAFAVPIRLNQEVLGVMVLFSRRVCPPDRHLLRLLRDICSQIGQVLGRRRAERQLLEVSERQQQRIGQDLHDGLCQYLAGLAYLASDLQTKLARKSLPEESASAARIAELARETGVQARQVARGLNPVALGRLGLPVALADLTASIRSMFGIACRFECQPDTGVADHETSVHLYRITQEAIRNAITHGRATRIVVALQRESAAAMLTIRDNGRSGPPASAGLGMGLENMKYRARTIGARLEFARRPGGGTVVSCALPAAAPPTS